MAVNLTTPAGMVAAGGGVDGAVKATGAPLAACAVKVLPGEKDPQGGPPHWKLQSTPAFVGSFETTAASVVVALVSSVLGGGWLMLIETGALTVNCVKAL